jgi:hypothetical protein
MDYDYQVISNGKVTNYIWDDEQRKMVEGKRGGEVPRWQLHQIAENLGGTISRKTIVYSNGKHVKQITIEYEGEND